MKRVPFSLALLLGVVACAGSRADQPPPEHVIGKYVYAQAGSVAGHAWSVKADLILERDAQYALDLRLHIHDENEHETSYGTYYVDGDRLVLEPADDDDRDEFNEWIIRGDRLVPKLGWPAKLALKGLKAQPVFVKAD